MRPLSEAEANQVLHAVFDPTLSFAPGSLGGNQPLGGKFANARLRMPMDDAQFGKALDDALTISGRIFAILESQSNCLTRTPADPACVAAQVGHFARVLWRGNVAEAALQPMIQKYTTTAEVADAREAVVQIFTAMLLAPEFLYRFEFGRTATQGTLELAPLELAENLAFFLTGRPPTDALLKVAEAGQLSEVQVFDAELEALLESPLAGAQFASVIAQLLEYRNAKTKGNPNGPFTPEIARQMVDETDAYLRAAYSQNWSIAQILSEPRSEVTEELVAYYGGLPQVGTFAAGASLHEFAPGKRFGLLTQGSVLAGLADPNKIAIVHRGKVLRERVLCRGVPPLPASAQNLLPPPLPDQTERERILVHGESPACHQCHRYMDGIGYALDAFSNDGRFRDQVPTNDGLSHKPALTSGRLEGVSSGSVDFANTTEFFTWLATSDDAASCLTSSFVEYAQGANTLPAGECGDASAYLKAAPSVGVKDLVRRIAKDKLFRLRAMN